MNPADMPPRDAAEILSQMKSWILETFLKGAKVGAVRDQTPLLGGDLLDSIGMMELVVHLEETYGVTISTEEVTPADFGTVESAARFIAKKSGAP